MSQSDYIRYKKTSIQLKEVRKIDPNLAYKTTPFNQLVGVRKMDPILTSQDYITFKQYTLESTVINTSPTFNKLALPGQRIVFGMERKISNCPIASFAVCNRTNLRSNRRENVVDIIFMSSVPLNIKPGMNQTTIKTII